MLDTTYLQKMSEWIKLTIAEINSQASAVKDTDDVKLLKQRINLFIEELENKKREVNANIKEIRNNYDIQEPNKGFLGFGGRSRKDIDIERDEQISPWNTINTVLDDQIIEMKRILYQINKQVAEQTKK